MKTNLFNLIFVFILKIHTSTAELDAGAECLTADQKNTPSKTCPTDFPCHQTRNKCLKELEVGANCGEAHTVCKLPDLLCQDGKCLIKDGAANAAGCPSGKVTTTDTEDDIETCVKKSRCEAGNCKCKDGFPVNAASNVCKLKQDVAGCMTKADCLGTPGSIDCIDSTCKCINANYAKKDDGTDCEIGTATDGRPCTSEPAAAATTCAPGKDCVEAKCLTPVSGAGDDCSGNKYCSNKENHICQDGTCRIKQSMQNCGGAVVEPSAGDVAICVKHSHCPANSKCTCKGDFIPDDTKSAVCKIKVDEIGCNSHADCLGTKGHVKCVEATCQCTNASFVKNEAHDECDKGTARPGGTCIDPAEEVSKACMPPFTCTGSVGSKTCSGKTEEEENNVIVSGNGARGLTPSYLLIGASFILTITRIFL